jgi:hypothetical protein
MFVRTLARKKLRISVNCQNPSNITSIKPKHRIKTTESELMAPDSYEARHHAPRWGRQARQHPNKTIQPEQNINGEGVVGVEGTTVRICHFPRILDSRFPHHDLRRERRVKIRARLAGASRDRWEIGAGGFTMAEAEAEAGWSGARGEKGLETGKGEGRRGRDGEWSTAHLRFSLPSSPLFFCQAPVKSPSLVRFGFGSIISIHAFSARATDHWNRISSVTRF